MQSYTLEASYFRAIPDNVKLDLKYRLPPWTSIQYEGQLIGKGMVDIDDSSLLEFGKYFAHTITHYYNEKRLLEVAKLCEENIKSNADISPIYKSNEHSSKNGINSIKSNITVTSFRRNNK